MMPFPPMLAPLLTALRFLTVLPLRRGAEFDGMHFQAGLFFFPVIGLGIGVVALLTAALVGPILPPALTALVGIVVLAAISGCLHLDGLADSADGMLSSRPRAEKLVIMHDSRIGAMGVIAIVIVLLGKYAALGTALPARLAVVLLLMPLAGRCAIVVTMALLPYARPRGGWASCSIRTIPGGRRCWRRGCGWWWWSSWFRWRAWVRRRCWRRSSSRPPPCCCLRPGAAAVWAAPPAIRWGRCVN